MKFYEFLTLTTNYDELLQYLCGKNVIRNKKKCPRCENIMELKIQSKLIFHCTQNYYKQTRKQKRRRVVCNFKISALNKTWFSQGHLNINTICRLICYVLMMNNPRQIFLQKELNISAHTVVIGLTFAER